MYEDAPTRSLFAPAHDPAPHEGNPPYRVLDLGVYPGATLMAFGIPNVLGHHGNELDAFDKLMGARINGTTRLARLWRLFAASISSLRRAVPDSIPGTTSRSERADQRRQQCHGVRVQRGAEYARLVPAAIKAPQAQAIGALVNARFSYDGIVTLDSNSTLNPPPVATMPRRWGSKPT